MSAFPPLVACATCASRWPANVLDNFGRCPICGITTTERNTTMPTTTDEFRRDRHGFPIEDCHRCGGSGRYSFNPVHLDMCYGCSGSGLRHLVPKHHAAWRDAVRAAVRVVAQDLRHGDTVRPWGERVPGREVIAIEVDHEYRTAWSTAPDGTETDTAWRTTITWDDGTVTAYNGFTLFHRTGVSVDPAPFIAAAERGARYLRDRQSARS